MLYDGRISASYGTVCLHGFAIIMGKLLFLDEYTSTKHMLVYIKQMSNLTDLLYSCFQLPAKFSDQPFKINIEQIYAIL